MISWYGHRSYLLLCAVKSCHTGVPQIVESRIVESASVMTRSTPRWGITG